MNDTLVRRIEGLTGRKAHHLIRRGFFFSHRDLDKVLDAYERGEPFYLYTGRGPSSQSLHVGHLVPFQLTQWMQEVFQVPVVIQMTDDEKFLWKGADLETYKEYGLSNLRDIMAVGFIPELTYVVMDTAAIAQLYPNTLRIQRLISLSTARSVFGFDDSSNIGELSLSLSLCLCVCVFVCVCACVRCKFVRVSNIGELSVCTRVFFFVCVRVRVRVLGASDHPTCLFL